MVKISVIVPVYNVENYLKKCIDSIINQTFQDIEIICVNDGSTDNSRKILEEYKNKDSRIKIIDKENGGLSSARNAGIKTAEGEFLSFIDSDDWIDKTMLEKLYKNITGLNSDISICAVHRFDEEKQIIETIDEEGNVINFELYDIVEVDNQEYALIFPADDDEDSEDSEILLMRLVKEGENYLFETIEDEEEFNKVEEYIKTMDDEEDEEE